MASLEAVRHFHFKPLLSCYKDLPWFAAFIPPHYTSCLHLVYYSCSPSYPILNFFVKEKLKPALSQLPFQ